MEGLKFTQKPKIKPIIGNEDRIKAYSDISGNLAFKDRAKVGQMATIREIGGNMVEKLDRPGQLPLATREFLILCHLQDTNVVPQAGSIIQNQDGTAKFTMEKINNGATLQEWLIEYMAGTISEDIIQEILEETCEAIGKIWQKGVVHADLHSNNIVIGMKAGGTKMQPIIIDFGISKMSKKKFMSMQEELELELDPQAVAQFENEVEPTRQEMTYSEEFNFFRSFVEDIVGPESTILETLDQLARAADILDNPELKKRSKYRY